MFLFAIVTVLLDLEFVKHREELFVFRTPANSVESDLRLYHLGSHDKRGHMIKSHRNHAIFNAITSPISVK